MQSSAKAFCSHQRLLNIHSAEKSICPLHDFLVFAYLLDLFQIIKHIVISDKESKLIQNAVFKGWFHILREKGNSKPNLPYVEKVIPLNWLWLTWQQELHTSICSDCQSVFLITVEEIWPTVVCRTVVINPHWRGFKQKRPVCGHAKAPWWDRHADFDGHSKPC